MNWAVSEMSNRYNTFAEYGVRNLEEFNRKIEKMKLPGGRAAAGENVSDRHYRRRACRPYDGCAWRGGGCHLPSGPAGTVQQVSIWLLQPRDHLLMLLPVLLRQICRRSIAFAVTSGVDSRTILDMNGAEKLLGKGDMLFYPQGYQKPARLQGAFVSDDEVSSIVDFLAG